MRVDKLVDLVVLHDDPAVTVFDGVARLPNGHVLVHRAGSDRVEVRPWFEPSAEQDRSVSPADAPALMRQAVVDAVRASLPADGDVAATLSGGLDSSTVAATAARLIAPDGRRVRSFTHVPLPGTADPGPAWDADDGPFAEAVAAAVDGLTYSPVANTDLVPPLESDRWAIERTWQPPFNPLNQVWANEIVRRTEGLGLELLLTGSSGNATFSRSHEGVLRELSRHGRLDVLVRQARLRHATGATWPRAVRSVVRETLPERVLAWRRAQRWRRAGGDPRGPGVFADMPARWERLSDAARAEYDELVAGLAISGRRAWVDFARLDVARLGMSQNMSDTVWWSDPLSDPEVIALALRLPEEAWLAGGRDRGLAREAAAGLLPDVVRLRTTYGAQAADGEAWVVGQEPAYRAMLERFRASPTVPEFLDLDRLDAAIGPDLTDPDTASLWQDMFGRAFSLGQFAVWYEDEVLRS